MKKLLELINQYWSAIAILITGISFIWGIVWQSLLMPQIDSHIDSRVRKMATDSLGYYIDNHMVETGGGFRGALADSTGLSKTQVVKRLTELINEEGQVKGEILKLKDEVSYQHGYNFFLLKNIAQKMEYKGVIYWQPYDGNTYYQDMYGLVWDAKYDAYDDCYYYYPSYGNGNRLKCE